MLPLLGMARGTDKTWQAEVSELLARAAELCVEHEVDVDPFVRGAYSAYVSARPELQEEILEQRLTEQLDELRRTGRIARA